MLANRFGTFNTNHPSSWRAATGALAALLLIAQLTGCGIFDSRAEHDPASLSGGVTPSSEGVYVNNSYLHIGLEAQDESEGPVPPNDHPVDLRPARIRAWLAGLKIKPEDSDEPIPLIPENELDQLSVIVAQALGEATSHQDVVFHSFRRVGAWYGSSRRDTTARVFYRNGALNLIFGDLDDFYSEQIDRDLQPLRPGSRAHGSELSARLIKSPEFAFVNHRDDWIRIDTSRVAAAEPQSTGVTPATAPPAANIPAPVTSTTTAPAAPAEQVSQDPRWARLEERLLILEGLHQKGLITDKDYAQKKQELLKVLDL